MRALRRPLTALKEFKRTLATTPEVQEWDLLEDIINKPSAPLNSLDQQELYKRFLRSRKALENLGSNYSEQYSPYSQRKHVPKLVDLQLQHLIAAECHLGHSVAHLNPKFKPFVYGQRQGISIISLPQTLISLRRAANVVADIRYQNGIVLFASNKQLYKDIVIHSAKICNSFHLFDRWIPGLLTNSRETLRLNNQGNVRKYKDGKFVSKIQNINPRLAFKPDIVVFLNPANMLSGVRECVKLRIPTVGIIDSNTDPTIVTYPIPANDDSYRSVQMLSGVISKTAALTQDLAEKYGY